MEPKITELRAQRRPLWMTYLGTESYEDFIGGGGDILFDRLPHPWERKAGETIEEEESEQEMESSSGKAARKPN